MKKSEYSIRSDFADEWFSDTEQPTYLSKQIKKSDLVRINWIKVLDDNNPLKKQKGDYVTLEYPKMDDAVLREEISNELVLVLEELCENYHVHKILVVGLGNRDMISDCIGPLTCDEIMVTAHLFELNQDVESGINNCAALSPRVMGQTGLESAAIVKSVSDFYQPDLILVVDALATESLERINKVIQISNTGIRPGSGVGNHRLAINEEEMKVPVISVGVATVTTIGAIVNDVLQEDVDINHEYLDFIVTPRNIDVDAKQIVSILAHALNCFIHPSYDQL